MTEAKLVHELDADARIAAVMAFTQCHSIAPDLGFAPDRAWILGWAFAQPAGVPAAAPDARDGLYYLQDARWASMVGNCPSFWRPDGSGYTTNLDEAARFTFAEAMAQHRCRETDLPWLCSEVDKLRQATIDHQYMPRSWDEQRAAIAAQADQKGAP